MHDADERNELSAVVFHKQDVAITDLEFRRIGHLHRLTAHCTAKHLQSDLRSGLSFNRVLYLKSNITVDVALTAFPNPLRTHISNRSLKDYFGTADELIKGRWNDCRGECAAADREDPSASE